MRITVLLLISFKLLALTCFAAENNKRSTLLFNENWKFSLTDSSFYFEADLNDTQWRKLSLPHDWSIEGEFSEASNGRIAWLPSGSSWYRKTFDLPKSYQGRHIEIQFDGIYKNATIWLNNYLVGKQHDGYTSFYYDITELLHFDKSNVLAVHVDNSAQPNCRWYSGSGIYRNVWLNVYNPTYVATWGTFITTPLVTAEEASIKVVTSIENLDEAKNINLQTIIYNTDGEEVAQTSSDINMARFCIQDFEQELTISSPQRWSVNQPVLYKAITSITENNLVVDEYQTSFGIRTIEFDAEKGFFLNGENLKMKGVCIHHDAGPLGAAVPKAVWERRLKTLKNIGCNAIRTAHNPMAPEFMDLCDEMGFLVMNEFVDKWDKPYKDRSAPPNPFFDVPFADPLFSTEWKKNYENIIRRDRNHPSVIMWSVGNENYPPNTLGQKNGLRNYATFVRTLDPTRPVISGMERGPDKPVNEKVNDIIETCRYMDFIALNYGEQWCAAIGEQQPDVPYVSTESYTYFNSLPEKRMARVEHNPWIDVIENEHNMGLFLWVGIDYLGESKKFPKTGSNSGLLDLAGFRKNRSFLFEAFWSDKPMVHIEIYKDDPDDFSNLSQWGWPQTSSHWNFDQDKVNIVTYTNCESVNLYLNGTFLGNQTLANFPNWIMKWKIMPYEEGTIKAAGVINGEEVCEHTLNTAGEPTGLTLITDANKLESNAIIHIEIELQDENGNMVKHTDRELNFKLEGDGEIIGIHNGDINCVVSNSNVTKRSTYGGRCLCILKTNHAANELELTISGENLETKHVRINTSGITTK